MAQFAVHDRQAGFTLIEMLTVLTIIALALTVSLPYARRSSQAQNLPGIAHKIAAVLRLAHSKAIAAGQPVDVTFDRELRRFFTPDLQKPVQVPAEVSLKFLTAKQQITQSEAFVRFFPDGTSTGGHVKLKNGTQNAAISINWLTGGISHLKVEEGTDD